MKAFDLAKVHTKSGIFDFTGKLLGERGTTEKYILTLHLLQK